MARNVNGLVLIDAPYSALNNSGTDVSERTENISRTKVIRKGRSLYPYVSGQAFRYWWRNTLEDKFNWILSPVEREKKIAFTEADPVKYPDDDVFGYMRAPKGKGNETLTRASVLKTSPLISVVAHKPTSDFAVMARQDGDPVPFEYEFYSTVLKGIFSLDLEQVGVFYDVNRSGYKNLRSDQMTGSASGLKRPDGSYAIDKSERIQRAQDLLKALHVLKGGAKQATNLTDVVPKFLILTTLDGGNHVFVNVIKEEDEGAYSIDFDALKGVLIEYKDLLASNVVIGRRAGFLDDQHELIESFVNEMKVHDVEVVYQVDIKESLETFSQYVPELIE